MRMPCVAALYSALSVVLWDMWLTHVVPMPSDIIYEPAKPLFSPERGPRSFVPLPFVPLAFVPLAFVLLAFASLAFARLSSARSGVTRSG